jgi:hypothetical protein
MTSQQKELLNGKWIRFKDGKYKKPGGKKRCDNETQNKRHLKLKEWLDYALINNPIHDGDFIKVIYLFYDGYSVEDKEVSLMKLEIYK